MPVRIPRYRYLVVYLGLWVWTASYAPPREKLYQVTGGSHPQQADAPGTTVNTTHRA